MHLWRHQVGALQESREISAVALRCYAVTFFTFRSVEASDLVVHFTGGYLTVTSLRSNTEVGSEWLLRVLKIDQANLVSDLQNSNFPQSRKSQKFDQTYTIFHWEFLGQKIHLCINLLSQSRSLSSLKYNPHT